MGIYFEGDNDNTIFNSFLNTYLKFFHSSFPQIKAERVVANNSQIMREIKLCQCKERYT
jgi:hypothetical protein